MRVTDQQAHVAAQVFFSVARIEFARRNPGQPWPHGEWAALDMATRRAFIRCARAAVAAATDPMQMARYETEPSE